MPSIGKYMIPEKFRKFLDADSPIENLFAKKCEECVSFKTEIALLNSKTDLLEEKEFQILTTLINRNYRTHLEKNHSVDILKNIETLEKYIL